MSRIILNTKIWLFVLLFGMSFPAWAQSDDFNTWTKFKVNYKIDSRFSVSGDLELRMKDATLIKKVLFAKVMKNCTDYYWKDKYLMNGKYVQEDMISPAGILHCPKHSDS